MCYPLLFQFEHDLLFLENNRTLVFSTVNAITASIFSKNMKMYLDKELS